MRPGLEGFIWAFRADADLKLLGSRRLPKDGFKGKVVWITGASQVISLCSGTPQLTLLRCLTADRSVF